MTEYGRDENVTRLLDTSRVHLLPSMNPDGFAGVYGQSASCYGDSNYEKDGISILYVHISVVFSINIWVTKEMRKITNIFIPVIHYRSEWLFW